jgi:glycosyltransferase involved in cell wall biosynthesis
VTASDPGPTGIELSVVVPCLNSAESLPQLFTQLAGERLDAAWELVVVDNGSTDRSRAVAEGWADRLPVRVVDGAEHRGAWHARNVGVAAARSEQILFLDSDDLIKPGYLATMHAALREADAVAARLDPRVANPAWSGASRPDTVVDGLFDHFDFLPYAPTCTMGLHRGAFEQIGGFSEMPFGEDVDLSWRLQLAGNTFQSAPEAVVYYRYRTTLRSMFRQARGYGRGQPALYRRYRTCGMPRRRWREVGRSWRGVLVQLAYARSRRELASALYLLGVYLGRIEGSVRCLVIYL